MGRDEERKALRGEARASAPWWRRKWFSWPLAGAVIAGCAWGVSISDVFSARRVEVAGVSHLASAEVRRLAGVGQETNVLWLDTGAVERRLEGARWIADARVERSLPSTLHIEVVERTPVAQVEGEEGWWLVASDGTVLDRSRRNPGLSAVVIPAFEQPERVGDRPRSLRLATAPLGSLAPWLLRKVSQVEVDVEGTIVLDLMSGVEVVYGDPAASDAKARSLAGILRWSQERDIRLGRIDVRAPLSPAALPWTAAISDPEPAAPAGGHSDVRHGRGSTILAAEESAEPSPEPGRTKSDA